MHVEQSSSRCVTASESERGGQRRALKGRMATGSREEAAQKDEMASGTGGTEGKGVTSLAVSRLTMAL